MVTRAEAKIEEKEDDVEQRHSAYALSPMQMQSGIDVDVEWRRFVITSSGSSIAKRPPSSPQPSHIDTL